MHLLSPDFVLGVLHLLPCIPHDSPMRCTLTSSLQIRKL